MEDILSKKTNKKILLLGNEAIVRGALESGVQFVSTYPGTPASEIGNTFAKIAKKADIYFEFSTNEKVAMEAAAGASFSGLRTLVAMKHFGLNVASDFLMPLVYSVRTRLQSLCLSCSYSDIRAFKFSGIQRFYKTRI